jgi:hypothetical protein
VRFRAGDTGSDLPFGLAAAFRKEEEILDGLSDGNGGLGREDARHRFSRQDAQVGIVGDRRDVVGDQNTSLPGGPIQNLGIVHTHETDVLNPHDVQTWTSVLQAPNDLVVEVLVSEQTEHGSGQPR